MDRNFNSFRKLFVVGVCLVTVLLIYLMIDAFISDNFLQFVICVVGEFVFIIFLAKSADRISKSGNNLKNEISKDVIKREGLLGEIWNFIDDLFKIKEIEVEHLDKSNNIIDLVLFRNEHEFGIVIDDEAISITVDEEESDNPLEIEMPISNFKDIEHFGKWLIDFIESNS